MKIGRERLRQLLVTNDVTFQRTKTWKESNDPDRDAKLDRIEHVLEHHPDRTFAFDEFGPLAIRPVGGSCWAPTGRPQRQPANYHKFHGVRQFHGCYSVGDDELWDVVRKQNSAANTLMALKSIRARRPDGDWIYVTLDNLSAHKGKAIRRRAKRNNVELCFTPTYSSWANPIEAHFGPLREFVLNNSNHPNQRRAHPSAPGPPSLAQRECPCAGAPRRSATRTSASPSRERTPMGQTRLTRRLSHPREGFWSGHPQREASLGPPSATAR